MTMSPAYSAVTAASLCGRGREARAWSLAACPEPESVLLHDSRGEWLPPDLSIQGYPSACRCCRGAWAMTGQPHSSVVPGQVVTLPAVRPAGDCLPGGAAQLA